MTDPWSELSQKPRMGSKQSSWRWCHHSTMSALPSWNKGTVITAQLGIGIPASGLSVRYRSIPLPDWVPLFRYRTGSGNDILFIPVPDWSDAGSPQSGI